jgi:heat shock protein HtpX
MSSGPLKAWIFLLSLSVLIVVTGYTVGSRQGLLVGVGLALGINCLIFFYGDLRTLHLFACRRLEGQDPWNLAITIQKLASQARVPVPMIYIVEHPTPQAFSIGRNWTSAKICLTRGLLDLFGPDEIAAVLAVELTRIQRLDIFSFQVACAVSDSLFLFAEILDRAIGLVVGSGSTRRPRLASRLLMPLAALAVRLTVSPTNYLYADKKAAEWLHDANGLARVLWKLTSYAATQPLTIPPTMAHLFIVNPLTGQGRHQYFHVQPTIQQRIEFLVGYYPL